MSKVTLTKVLIVGAGPIGLELAACLKHAGVDYLHVEAGQIGQTMSWYPINAHFFSSPERIAIAGLPLHAPDQSKTSREQYLTYLRGVVEYYDLKIRTYETVTHIQRLSPTGFHVTTTKTVYHADNLVLAIGDMHGPRKLNIPGEDLPQVSHYFVEPHRYFRQKLLIVGGRNSAVEAALRCQRVGAYVTLSYRRADFDLEHIKYWLYPELKSLIRAGKITFKPQTVPVEIHADHVVLHSPIENRQSKIPSDFVLLLTGYVMDSKLFELAGVTLKGENRAPVYDQETMQTDVPGLYVAGTAAAGTQVRFHVFIENSHPHVARIVQALTGSPPPDGLVNPVARDFALPES
ncbi:MAG: NAD(P)-binding domain-containing protein [Phycisphaeraceae bacterium]|nr:NAD(P)-binding domain-containing protein [Phycisphaeraceae bacterium]